jgi:hypothetical protein
MGNPLQTSGTFNFAPTVGELTLYAFHMAGVRPTALTQSHMESARIAANMINSRWSAVGINLWAVDLQTITLIPGNATYSVPANTIAILDAYASRASGAAARDRIILPVSRTEYASYSNKAQRGAVTVFWYDQLLAPQVTFYMTPDGNYPTVSYYRVRQIQDAVLAGGATPEIPFYFLEAYATGLAQRLAQIWNPAMAGGLKTLADEAFEIAANRNTEQAAYYISPMVAPYWRA